MAAVAISRTQDSLISKSEVENFLRSSIKEVLSREGSEKGVSQSSSKHLSSLSSFLVERVNSSLAQACPSIEGFKFVVQAVVQEQWGQGGLVGARCQWDNRRDTVVSVQQETEKLDVCVIVFFVHTEEESDEEQ